MVTPSEDDLFISMYKCISQSVLSVLRHKILHTQTNLGYFVIPIVGYKLTQKLGRLTFLSSSLFGLFSSVYLLKKLQTDDNKSEILDCFHNPRIHP